MDKAPVSGNVKKTSENSHRDEIKRPLISVMHLLLTKLCFAIRNVSKIDFLLINITRS